MTTLYQSINMSSEATTEPLRRDFRSSYYYKSLHGFKGGSGEKSLTHLEALIKMEVLDAEKLKVFCLQHTLPDYYRSFLWKILLDVLPVYTDKDTTKFIEDQKTQQYCDLRHALQVMGKIPSPVVPHTLEQVAEKPIFQEEGSPLQSRQSPAISTAHVTTPISATPTECVPSEVFVMANLLENNKLLSATENQLEKIKQVRLKVIAEAFLSIFEEEEVSSLYWMFSGFLKMCEARVLPFLDTMVTQCLECLAEEDSVLHSHLKSIGAISSTLPLRRWFYECFATDLPESCLESVWDRLIGGSCMVLVYVAVAILLSVKRRILGLSSASDLIQVLQTIPKENFTAIVSKGLQLWEAHNSPLLPHN